ncbi:MAG: STAS domain-containing protein [Actinomycetes bacterium]
MEETSSAAPSLSEEAHRAGEPEVTAALEGNVARLTLRGELTGESRRPLVRLLTDLLLQVPALQRVELDLRAVPFLNSAGIAVLVQAQRMTAPRAIEVALVGPPPAVARPLQLSGLWHRFTVVDQSDEDAGGS